MLKSKPMVKVELPNNKYRWYRLSPKISYAISMERKNSKSKKGFLEFAAEYLDNCLINVPLSGYKGHKAIIGVGKIIDFKFATIETTEVICTRSQFVTLENLTNSFRKSYKYMRHDFLKYSRLNIFVNLYNWRIKYLEKKSE